MNSKSRQSLKRLWPSIPCSFEHVSLCVKDEKIWAVIQLATGNPFTKNNPAIENSVLFSFLNLLDPRVYE